VRRVEASLARLLSTAPPAPRSWLGMLRGLLGI
jgi:hypothetical protein